MSTYFFFFSKILANFGAHMGCAIGMSLIAAFEILYWIILKPFMKLIDNSPNPSPTQKRFSRLLYLFAFVAFIVFAGYRFNLVHQLIQELNTY